jgi:hypothetical protein
LREILLHLSLADFVAEGLAFLLHYRLDILIACWVGSI